MPRLASAISLLLCTLSLFQTTTATYVDDYSKPSVPPIYLSPTLTTSTHNAFYAYPTSTASNCSCHYHTQPHQHPGSQSTYISVVHGTASHASGYPVASESANGTYHSPALSTANTGVSTTVLSTTSATSSNSNVSTSSASGTTQEVTTTSQSPSPTQSEPAEPMFTGNALRLPELQVWKWNIIVSVGLGFIVMWI